MAGSMQLPGSHVLHADKETTAHHKRTINVRAPYFSLKFFASFLKIKSFVILVSVRVMHTIAAPTLRLPKAEITKKQPQGKEEASKKLTSHHRRFCR